MQFERILNDRFIRCARQSNITIEHAPRTCPTNFGRYTSHAAKSPVSHGGILLKRKNDPILRASSVDVRDCRSKMLSIFKQVDIMTLYLIHDCKSTMCCTRCTNRLCGTVHRQINLSLPTKFSCAIYVVPRRLLASVNHHHCCLMR